VLWSEPVTADPSARRLGHCLATRHSFCRHSPPLEETEYVSARACSFVAAGVTDGEGVTLLKLRKVELVGFKSFCEKTHLTFSGTGLSCIIGPNGCGKSNIVDAISWVLGEQSHKSLRAERMADCIFNGTAKRPPMGLAEVTLTLVDAELAEAARRVLDNSPSSVVTAEVPADSDQNLPVPAEEAGSGNSKEEAEIAPIEDATPLRKKNVSQKPRVETRPGEVVIARRLYRSGQSDYLINGRTARLRDIQELFMGIGLGPDSYAIIEQGRIGQVLSSKPSDRRAIIEEAAGITKYKTKKRLAEAKLESSKVNLSRVNDIFVEVEKQLASLKRQASKARRFTEIREQMRGLLRTVLASKARTLDDESERLTRVLAGIADSEIQQAQSIAQLESEQERLDRRIDELDTELRQNQNLMGQSALELDRAENRILFNRQRREELSGRERQLSVDQEQAAAQMAQLEKRLGLQGEIVAHLREDRGRLESVLAELAAGSSELAATTDFTEARVTELRRLINELEEALAQLQETQAQAEQSLAHHSGALEGLEKSERELLEESLYHRERSQVAAIRWQTVTEQARALEQSVLEARQRLATLRREQTEAMSRCEGLRDALASARARRQTLEQILKDRSYTAEAVQKLFASNGESTSRDFRAVGVLADYAEVEPQYESAIEQFLRDELEYVVVETFDHARAGIAMLREEVGGRATFFVDSLRSVKSSSPQPMVPFAAEPGVVSRLDQLVEFRDPLGPAAKQFLPRLQSAFLVDASEAAERLARQNPSYSFLMPDGTCYQGRAVTGGRPAEAGPLVMKRELRSLEAQALHLEREAAEARSALERIEGEQHEAQGALERATGDQVEAGKAVVAATLERDQARSELARLGMELASCQKEIERLRKEAQAARQKAEGAMQERQATLNARETAEREVAEAMVRAAEIRQLTLTQHEELAAQRAEKAAMEERLTSALAIAQRMGEERQELASRAAALLPQQTAIVAEREALAHQDEDHTRQVEWLRAECRRLEAHKTDLEREWNQARTRTAELDHALRSSRQKLNDLREDRSRREIENARNDAEREHLRLACGNELSAQPEDLMAEQASLLAGQELAAAETQYQEMKARVESMGPINMMALEEYNECEQRFGFLERERADLLQSIADTQQAIGELDQVSRQKFEEAFAIVNTHFASAFQVLFGGGTGQMRLSEPDSSGEAGIDIAAQPPGKRLQNVLLLSGGEKALTALALLIAIFRYQPSPFCILDEVDAPLDESNVGRFVQMVSEMSADAQFIVVTHNRRTMEMASVLYGVTMQEPGVSKLVSVSWEQARAVAESNAA
jgi:chromosome segregation protein